MYSFPAVQKKILSSHTSAEMGAGQAMKRIPLIKFPQRHPKASGATLKSGVVSANENIAQNFFSKSQSSTSLGGKASDQPKRTPVSQEEIDAILLGGCF